MTTTPHEVNPLGERINMLQQTIDLDIKNNADDLHGRLKQELTQALYLWLWWIFPDGAWTPGDHWGGQTDYRHAKCKSLFGILRDSKDLQREINDIFYAWEVFFSEYDYIKLQNMFRLFFILEKTNFISDSAMNILEWLTNEPWLQLDKIHSPRWYIWYADSERSYTQEAKERRREELIEGIKKLREQEAEKMRIYEERLSDLRKRLSQHLIDKWICPDCKKLSTECVCDLCSDCKKPWIQCECIPF